MSIKSVLKKILLEDIPSRQEHATLAKGKKSTLSPKISSTAVHGTVAISGGKILVTDPENYGSYATLLVPATPVVQVFVNGEQVQGEVVLSESHRVDIEFSSAEPSVTYDVMVSDDEESVSIKANVVAGVELHLKDSAPSRHLKLGIEENSIHPPSGSPQPILDLLSQHGFRGAIDYRAVSRLCDARATQEEIVLRGTRPHPEKPAQVRLSANLSFERCSLFRLVKFPLVFIGDTCATVEPGREWVPGVNVYGVPTLPPPTHQKPPAIGDGVIMVDTNVVANRDGRLVFSRHLIDVVPEMVLETDVSMDDGEIEFHGNLTIHGSIRNGAIVKATGTIAVYGSIEASSVFSGQGLFVRDGVYRSNLSSGYQQMVYNNLSELLDQMIPEVKRFGDEYALMVAHALKRYDARTAIPRIPEILFEKRHDNLVKMVERFMRVCSTESCWLQHLHVKVMEILESTWTNAHRSKVTQKDCELLFTELESLTQQIKSSRKPLAIVRANDVASSTIRSVGNIIIERNCYTSTLESDNTVSVQKTIVGGFVTARKSVYVNELGNPSGVETTVRVHDQRGFVRVKLNHINTLVEVHGHRSRTYNTERDIRYGGM